MRPPPAGLGAPVSSTHVPRLPHRAAGAARAVRRLRHPTARRARRTHGRPGLDRRPARRRGRQRPHADAGCDRRRRHPRRLAGAQLSDTDVSQPLHPGHRPAPGPPRHRPQQHARPGAGQVRVERGQRTRWPLVGRRADLEHPAAAGRARRDHVLAGLRGRDRRATPTLLAAVRRQEAGGGTRRPGARLAGPAARTQAAAADPVPGAIRRGFPCRGHALRASHAGAGDDRCRAGPPARGPAGAWAGPDDRPHRAVRPRHGRRARRGHPLPRRPGAGRRTPGRVRRPGDGPARGPGPRSRGRSRGARPA